MKRILLTTFATVVLPLAAVAQLAPPPPSVPAQISNGTPSDTSSEASGSVGMAKLSVQDAHFIKVAAIAGMAEVNDGKLAAKIGDSTVRKVGETMVTDHTKANDQLTSIAKAKGVSPPMQVDAKHAAVTARLQTLSGVSFDRQYLKTELTGHEMTIAAFKAEASTGSDADLKSFASSTLPVIEMHLAMIKKAIR